MKLCNNTKTFVEVRWFCLFCSVCLDGPSVFRSGFFQFFFFFLAIFGNFEAREIYFEFSHESGQKKSQKKSVATGKNRFFFVFFLPTFMGELKVFFPGFKIAKNS